MKCRRLLIATAGACLLALPAAAGPRSGGPSIFETFDANAVGRHKQAEVDPFRPVFAVDFISSVRDYRLYVEDLYGQVSTLVREGKTLEEVKEAVDLSKYKYWGRFDRMSQATIEGMYRGVSLHRLPSG